MSRSLFDAENFPSFNKPWIRMLMGELYSPRETHFVWAVCDVHDCEEYDFLYTRRGFLITRIPQTHVKRLGSVPVVMGFLQLHPHLLYHSGWCFLHVFYMYSAIFYCIILPFTSYFTNLPLYFIWHVTTVTESWAVNGIWSRSGKWQMSQLGGLMK